ncbi:glycosyltransferase family 1 protein [soil metagenome]
MKVLHVQRIGGIGGSERHVLELLPALRARGIDASFLGLDDTKAAPEPFYAALAERDIPFEQLPCPRDLDPRLAAAVIRAVRAIRTDIIHTHLIHADAYGALASAPARAVLVSTKHNDDPFRSGRGRYLEKLLTRRASRVICITEALARFNRDVVGLPDRKLRLVHYGLDAPPEPWGPPGGPDLPAETPVLVAVCRLVPQKGVDIAIEALVRIREQHPATHLVVLGEGPLWAELTERAATRGVADAVSFPGRVGDVAWWLRRATVVIHPARWEGFGLALLEAMLCERSVVASSVSSIPEIVLDGETGLLVKPDDPARLAEAVVSLLDDPARARALGEAGGTRAREEFSVARMAERTAAVYEESLSSSRR